MDISRRTLIGTTTGTLALTLLPVRVAHAAQMVDVRMWPAEEYTRVTLEHDEPIKFKYFLVRSPMPYRLVVDIEGLKLTAKLQKMISDVSPKDPYIQAVRIGQFTPTVVRLVMDLKSEVRPEVFSLKPVANYKYRLIFDIYPVQSEDPIAGVIAGLNNKGQQKDPLGDLIAQNRQSAKQNESSKETKTEPQKPAQTAKNTNAEKNKAQASTSKSKTAAETKKQTQPKALPKKTKDIVIVVDAGHGGEDPGAAARRHNLGGRGRPAGLCLPHQRLPEAGRGDSFRGIRAQPGGRHGHRSQDAGACCPPPCLAAAGDAQRRQHLQAPPGGLRRRPH